jgi:hypothetical protein
VNLKSRDFRTENIGNVFKSEELSDSGQGVYVGIIKLPVTGFYFFYS